MQRNAAVVFVRERIMRITKAKAYAP